VNHLIRDGFSLTGNRVITLSYEDFVGSPRASLRTIANFAGMPVGEHDLDFVSPRSVRMREDHTAVGNDSRLDQGTITLREDDAWRTKLPAQDRKLVTLMSWPLLKRWRYV